MSSFTFLPTGGLANRMRAIAAAVNLATHVNVDMVPEQACPEQSRREGGAEPIEVEIIWFQGWGMRAPFSALFLPIEGLRDATWRDKVFEAKGRWSNLFVPSLYQWCHYDACIKDQNIFKLLCENFDFEAWAKGRNTWMSCYHRFGNFDDYEGLLRRLFVPQEEVARLIDNLIVAFPPYTIGVHIRRTDNSDAIKKSPTSLFVEAVEKELAEHTDAGIFLATDDEPTKVLFREHFGDAVITAHHAASRDSIEGIQEGLADMFALSKTKHIYGTTSSSFSVMASQLGDIPLKVLMVG